MLNVGFVGCLAVTCFFVFRWAFRALPQEKYQVMATVPLSKSSDGSWQGLNLTFYGFFIAWAYLLATISVFVLLGSLSISSVVILILAAAMLIICVPSAKFIARLVEKKAYTFSVGGAAFVGILVAPWILFGIEKIPDWRLAPTGIVLPGMATFAIAYALGEGLGRLACISFGCCYGKPIDEVPRFFQRLVGFRAFIFTGQTKKVAYASQLNDQRLFPVQALTSSLYTGIGLVGMFLFLEGRYVWAFILTLAVTQLWRFFSEFLRADFRGNQKITAYQCMALLTVPYAVTIAYYCPAAQTPPANLLSGLTLLWNPLLIFIFMAIWLGLFLYTGRSQVTAATLNIFVKQQNI